MDTINNSKVNESNVNNTSYSSVMTMFESKLDQLAFVTAHRGTQETTKPLPMIDRVEV